MNDANRHSFTPKPWFISRPSGSRRMCRIRSIIVTLDDGGSVTARVDGERVAIDDRVVETDIARRNSFFSETTYETG